MAPFAPVDAPVTPRLMAALKARLWATRDPTYCNWNIIRDCSAAGTFHVVASDGRPVAFVAWEAHEVLLLWTDPEYRLRGLARRVLRAVPAGVWNVEAPTAASKAFWAHIGAVPSMQGPRVTHHWLSRQPPAPNGT